MKITCCCAAILFAMPLLQLSSPTSSAQSQPRPGDGIFTPLLSPVASVDKTGRPFTIETTEPQAGFSNVMVAGKPTGDSYFIHFSTGAVGGPCIYTGESRYFIESTGTLTFQMLADCGKLKRGYSYMICRLNGDLRCSEAPWWYFKGETFAVTEQGVVIDGFTVPWKDAPAAPLQLQTMAAKIQSTNDRFRNDPRNVHSRLITCRNFHPATKSYDIHELPTTCFIKSLCNGIPTVDSLGDGEPINWDSPVGIYVKQQNKISDVSTWSCWVRTQ
jgi:hypothetical protein